jgi:hypothetical protein
LNNKVTEFAQLKGINWRLSSPYYPQANGCIERVHATLAFKFKKMCNFIEDDWANHLENCVFAYNISFNRSINRTPFKAFFGCRYSEHAPSVIGHKFSPTYPAIENNQKHQIHTKIKKFAKEYKKYYDKNANFGSNYIEGEIVWYSEPGKQRRKLEAAYTLLGKVIKVAYKSLTICIYGKMIRTSFIHVKKASTNLQGEKCCNQHE